MKKSFFAILILGLLFTAFVSGQGLAVTENAIGEGDDFATLELRNPWDMDAFYDISQGFNSFGAQHHLSDFQVEDGVFSARTGSGFSSFYALYPGYLPGLHTGKTGYQHPVDSNKYHCLSIASYVEPSALSYQVFNWVFDMSLSSGGYSYGMQLDPGKWKLYSYDLNTWFQTGMNWNSSNWMGLFLLPVNQANKYFAIDWIRLTDCIPVYYTLKELTPERTSYSIWVGTGTPERQILVQEGVIPDGDGSYQWDVQGIAPGTYSYYVKTAGGDLTQQGTLTIEAAPIPTFTSPSPFMGSDYSTIAGNPWDMRDNQDVTEASCVNYAILNDMLNADTLPPSSLPAGCVGGGAQEADPKIYLNTPLAVDISQYRYLSFRHKIDAEWSRPAEGMIIRWIWEMSGLGPPACKYVSREFALDVGWVTYWVDLHDPWNGTPAEVGGIGSGSCPKNVQWKTQPGTLVRFRLDPNENILNYTFHQEIDWIRLTKVPTVNKGLSFPIQVSLNKSPDAIEEITFYYTNDLNDPTQHLAQRAQAAASPPANIGRVPAADFPIFLPVLAKRYTAPIVLPPVENEVLFDWDTASVTPGEYYICALTSDGYNQTTFCSQAPVQVLP